MCCTLAQLAVGPTEDDNTILTAAEVHAYYRLGHTAGYQLTMGRAPLECAPGPLAAGRPARLDSERAAVALRVLLADGDP